MLTPSKTSKSSSEIHRLGKYISIALIPTLTGLEGISNSEETFARGVVDAMIGCRGAGEVCRKVMYRLGKWYCRS